MGIRDHLESALSVFIDSRNGWDFFVGIKDYAHYIAETPGLQTAISNLKRGRELLLEKELSLEKTAEKELLDSFAKVRTIITKNKLESGPEIRRIIGDIESYLNPNGGLSKSGKLSDNLDSYLFDICRNTPEEKRLILFRQFIDKSPRRNNIYGNFSFSKTIEERRDLTNRIEHKDNIELWSDWMRLEKVPPFIEADNIYKVELKDGDTKYAYELIKARIEYDNNKSIDEFTKLIPQYKSSLLKIHAFLVRRISQSTSEESLEKYKGLKSIHLVTDTLEPKKVIFLVLDEHYEIPIRCEVNNHEGRPAYIKKLYDLAYPANAPGKSVPYSRNLSDSISNGLFRLRQVALYMKANNLSKPTLVKKSEDGKSLVLKNEVTIKTALIKNIPPQYRYLYIDKTR